MIPAHNEEGYVGEALASCAAQQWSGPLEAVVVENGSTDGTAGEVEAFAAAHPDLRVRLVRQPVAARAAAKNRGAREAAGRTVAFLDGDSQMASDLAARVIRAVEAGFVVGSIRVRSDGEDPLDHAFFNLMEFGKVRFGIRAQMFYCARALFLSLGGFDESLQLAEDRDFLVRVHRSGVPVTHITESWIVTSPRRLHALPLRLGMVTMFARWALGHAGIGRRWPY